MLKGVYCPSITPITSEGRIDYKAWETHLEWLTDSGINGILIFGSIGEFYAFTTEEKKEAIAFAQQVLAGRTKLLVGTGSTQIQETIALNNFSLSAGADAAVIVSPYYFGPSSEATQRYYSQVARATKLPIVLYNFPDRTGTDLTPKITGTLASTHQNIIGIKDTVDSAAHTRKVIAATPADFTVWSGFDEYYLSNRIAGGAGVLSGLTNVVPELFVSLHNAYETGTLDEVHHLARKISDLMAVYDIGDHFINTIHHAVATRGVTRFTPGTREPYLPLAAEEEANIRSLIEAAVVPSGG